MIFGMCVLMVWVILRPQSHDTGFVSERHQFKVFSRRLVCSYNVSYLKLLFNYVILFKCQIHLEAVKFDVALMQIRHRVTGA